jgi:hypothetical protein
VVWTVFWTLWAELVSLVSELAGPLISAPVDGVAAGGSAVVAGRFAASTFDTTLAGSAARAGPAANVSKAITGIAKSSSRE